MSDWPLVRLGDHLRVKHGFAFQGEYFRDRGVYILLTPGNFIETGGFKPKSGTEKYFTADPPEQFVLRRGDLVIAMTEQAQGLLGSSALIPADGVYLHNQRIGLVEPTTNELDHQFLYYLFNTRVVRDQIQATATGSKVRHTAPARVESVTVPFPSLPIQRKIGAILSAYDDLIENNNSRIKLLEEMVQRIYHEWFVDFRYPGHEDVPLVDSELGPIPEGWKVSRTADLIAAGSLAIGDGYRAKNSEFRPEGWPFVRIRNLGDDLDFRHVELLPFEALPRFKDKISRLGDCVVSTKGTVGRIIQISDLTPPFVYSPQLSYWRLLDDALAQGYLRAWLQGPEFERQCAHVKGGTDMADYVNLKDQRRMLMVLPPRKLQTRFASVVDPLYRLSELLRSSRSTLRATRDLVLPRLVSGEIDVTDLEIAMPHVAL